MKIPPFLKVGGHTIEVVVKDLDDETSGKFSIRENRIYIDKSLPESQQGETLLHEIFHALNSEMDNSLPMHALLDSLSQQLFQVLSDNKLKF